MTTDSTGATKVGAVRSETTASSGSGAYSILGYEYQIDVSVWLALDLILASKLANEIILEPASEEDLEADVAEHEPGCVTSRISLGRYRLIVQAKRRSGDAWTVAGIRTLLNHGTVRKSAFQRLGEDVTARYLLVTSAGLNGETRELSVRRAGRWPKAERLSDPITAILPETAFGRVAIIGNQDEERLETDIEKILLEGFRIPRLQLRACWASLRTEARVRIGSAGGGRWTRGELEGVIRQHGGYIASSPELDCYVYPTNWSDLRTAIDTRHAALIIGQSGTGKTMATLKLYDELREVYPGLTRVPITLGPHQLESDTTPPPVLYDIVDPWGKFDFDPSSRPWNDQLSRFFSSARHDRLIVATSRRDVAGVAGALITVQPWVVPLEAEHYSAKERNSLYQVRIDDLPRALQNLAQLNQERVLEKLATPLEIQKFFDALTTIEFDPLRNPTVLVDEAIHRALETSIEQTVIDQIEARKDVTAAAVIWALLKVSDKLSIDLLRQIEEEFSNFGAEYDRGISPLLNFFVAARNLRQVEATVTYYHPRVESGIEKSLRRDRLVVQRTLRNLIDILVALDDADGNWGAGASARLIMAVHRNPDFKPKLSSSSQDRIDEWLASELAKEGGEFESNLKLAALAGSPRSDVSEVARFLDNGPDQAFGHMDLWFPQERADEWYSRMQASPAVRAMLSMFIREVLPRSRVTFSEEFVPEVERIAPGLMFAFIEAAETAVHYGVTSASEVIAAGALGDIVGFEKIVDMAVEVRTLSEAELAENASTSLAILNGEYGDEYAEHLSESDDGWTASEFLNSYVLHVRSTQSWQAIATHRHIGSLRPYWLQAMSNAVSCTEDEVAGAFNSAYGTKDEGSLWFLIAKAWDSRYSHKLLERVVDGHKIDSIRLRALFCMENHAPKGIVHAARTLFAVGRLGRFCELAVDFGNRPPRSNFSLGKCEESVDIFALIDEAPTLFRDVATAANAISKQITPTLSVESVEYIKSITHVDETVRLFRLQLASYVPVFVVDDVHWILANTQERENAAVAIKAAIFHQLNDDIEAALSHKFTNVVALALTAIGSPREAPLPLALLNLVRFKGYPVRRALVELLDAKPHAEHLPALLHLAHDTWSRNFSRHGEAQDYPIAKWAVAAICKLGQLDDTTASDLYRLAIDTADQNLRYEIFQLLVCSAEGYSSQLLDLILTPGRPQHRILASLALMTRSEKVAPELLVRITPAFLSTCALAIASRLLLLLSFAAPAELLLSAAGYLATHSNRRVILLLAIWGARDRLPEIASEISSMLPPNHAGIVWALNGAQAPIEDSVLADLGGPASVEQVLGFMQPKVYTNK